MGYIVIHSKDKAVNESLKRFCQGRRGCKGKDVPISKTGNTRWLKDTPETRIYIKSLLLRAPYDTIVCIGESEIAINLTKEEEEIAKKMVTGKISFRDLLSRRKK